MSWSISGLGAIEHTYDIVTRAAMPPERLLDAPQATSASTLWQGVATRWAIAMRR